MFLARPTVELRKFLKFSSLEQWRAFESGRLAMALEILTVVKTLEDERVPMLALQRAEIISVLETLLVDQGLDEVADRWYGWLGKFRQPKFVPIGNKPSDENASVASTLQDAVVLAEGTYVPPDERQSPDPSSDEWAEETDGEDESMRIGLSEWSDDSNPAELLRALRSRHKNSLILDHYHSEPEP